MNETTFQSLKRGAVWLVSGGLCFFVFQGILRIPMLTAMSKNPEVIAFAQSNPGVWIAFLALSAGLFEEFGRLIMMRFLSLKDPKCPVRYAVVFGLGHGIMEVLILLGPVLGTVMSLPTAPLVVYERLIAIAFHCAMSALIWIGIRANAAHRAVLWAVIAHTVTNLIAALFGGAMGNIVMIYAVLTALDVAFIALAWGWYQSLVRKGEWK